MPSTPRVSVALCTYNAGPFLQPQLDSLLAQTHRPHELVIADDGSTDGTLEAVRRFAAPFPVRIVGDGAGPSSARGGQGPHRHPTDGRDLRSPRAEDGPAPPATDGPLGPAQNFARAIAAATGDVIACCDQDDVWHPDKLATVAAAFAGRPDLGFAFSDADVVDADGRPLGYRLWDAVGFTPRLRRRFAADPLSVLVRQNVVTGATLAFAGRLRPLVLPIPTGWMHDGWVAVLAAATAGGTALPTPLIGYRRHAAQAVGAERMSIARQVRTARGMSRTAFAEQAAAFATALDRLATWPGVPPAALDLMRGKVAHCRTRSAIRLGQRPRLPASVGELLSLRYGRFSLGWKSFAQDLLL